MGKLFDSMKQRGTTLPVSTSVTAPRLQVVPHQAELPAVEDHETMPFYEVPNDQEPARTNTPFLALRELAPAPVVEKPVVRPAIITPPSSNKLVFTPAEPEEDRASGPAEHRLYADELIVIHRPRSPQAEEYRHLAEHLVDELTALQAHTLMLLPLQQESSTTMVANLGVAWADLTRHPLVMIDAARSTPGNDLACYFGLTHAPGWEELMTGSSLGESLQQTGRHWLDLIGSGRRLAWSNTQSWATQASQVLHTLQKHYRHVLLVGPSFPHSPLGLVLAEVTAATCLLVNAHGQPAHREAVQKSLAQAGKPVIGSIVIDG